jgi:hypothetical protein
MMKKSKLVFLFFMFSIYSFSQEKDDKSFALTYRFSSYVKGKIKSEDNKYDRIVNIYKSIDSVQNIKYSFYCMKFDFQGPNNLPYIRKVSYMFDEITVLVNSNGQITDVIKPADMDKRWLETKAKILQNYSGSAIINYLKQVEETIADKEKLIAFLQTDNMYGLFLKGFSEMEKRNPSSKIKKKGDLTIILPKTLSKDEKYEFTFKNSMLIKAKKISKKITYEINYLKPVEL